MNFQSAMTTICPGSTDKNHSSLQALEIICFRGNTKEPFKVFVLILTQETIFVIILI